MEPPDPVYIDVTHGYTYTFEPQVGGGRLPRIQAAVIYREELALSLELKCPDPFALISVDRGCPGE